MDPESLSAPVLAIAVKAVAVARGLLELQERYRNARLTIAALCAEVAMLNSSLFQLHHILCRRASTLSGLFRDHALLAQSCDATLTGCTVALSCLDDEIGSLLLAYVLHQDRGKDREWDHGGRDCWREGSMQRLTAHIRGQKMGLSLLLQFFQTYVPAAHSHLSQGETVSRLSSCHLPRGH